MQIRKNAMMFLMEIYDRATMGEVIDYVDYERFMIEFIV